jgi:hypothetical protein
MATTVTPANLTVTITEQYTLNNVAYGNTINKTFTTNGEIYQRIMAVKQSEVTELIAFGAADGLGTVDKSNYTSGDTFFYKLKAGESLLLMDNEMDAIASSTTFGAFADITSIKAQADTDGVDVELMCVTV